MATEQEKVSVYIPADEAADFKRLVEAEERTITAVLRRLIRDYIAERQEAAA